MRHIAILTTTRAEYGILKPLIAELETRDNCRLTLLVTGTHLASSYGNTINDIQHGKSVTIHKMDLNISADKDSNQEATRISAELSIQLATFLEEDRPDIIVMLGDRFELMGATAACVIANVPIAHLHGGEITEGAIDEKIRHAVTKLSNLHFAATQDFADNIIQMGENPSHVFNVGSLGVENILRAKDISDDEILEKLGRLPSTPLLLFTYHPVTTDPETEETRINEVCDGLRLILNEYPSATLVITGANTDTGQSKIEKALDTLYHEYPTNIIKVASLGAKLYPAILKKADVVIGNSSSGIIEAPAAKTPTINIGERQKGRPLSPSILSCAEKAPDILNSFKEALSPSFKAYIEGADCAYIGNQVSKNIADLLLSTSLDNLIRKYLHAL